MQEKILETKIFEIFNDNWKGSEISANVEDNRIYDRLKIGKEIMKLVSEYLTLKYDFQIEELAHRFIQTIKLAESRIPNLAIEQEIKAIITEPGNELIFQLDALRTEGYYIHTVVQDVHAKGGREAMYMVICSKIK